MAGERKAPRLSRFKCIRTVAACLVASLVLSGAASAPVMRWILSVEGSKSMSGFVVQREGKLVAAHLGLPLLVGDCVIRGRGATRDAALIVIVDGREVTIDSLHPRYCVLPERETNKTLIAIRNSFASFLSVFHQSDDSYNKVSTVSVQSRTGPSPTVPDDALLAGNGQKIVAGRRKLMMAWVGGQAPFTVTLARIGGRPLAPVRAKNFRLLLSAIDYRPGTYSVTIRDVKEHGTTESFHVVGAGDLPPATGDTAIAIGSTASPASLAATLDAARVMSLGVQWHFEAYQRVVEYEQQSELAKRLARYLELGS